MGFIERIKRSHQIAKLEAENELHRKRLIAAQKLLVDIQQKQSILSAEFQKSVDAELPELLELYNEMCGVLVHRQKEVETLKGAK